VVAVRFGRGAGVAARARRPVDPRQAVENPRSDGGPAAAHRSGQAESEQRRAAAAELALVGDLHGAKISPAARDLLLELLADLLGRHRTEASDADADLVLRAEPGSDTIVHSYDVTITFVALRLRITALAAWSTDRADERAASS
jgi:Protein of unknown function (DUF2397)